MIFGIIFAALSSVECSILFDTRPQRPLPNKRSADYNATPTVSAMLLIYIESI